MISYETILSEMEKHIALAKQGNSEQQLREHLTAIRALCDVGLATKQNDNPMTVQKTMKKMDEQPIIYTNLTSTPIEEEDANGSSIFDF